MTIKSVTVKLFVCVTLGWTTLPAATIAEEVVVAEMTRAAAQGGAQAPALRQLATGLRAGRVTLAEVEQVLAILHHVQALGGAVVPAAQTAGENGAFETGGSGVGVDGGVAAVEAVLAGDAPPVVEETEPALSAPIAEAEPAAPAEPDAIIIKFDPGAEDKPDLVMLEGAKFVEQQVLQVRKDGADLVQLKVLRGDATFSLAMVLAATWAEGSTEQVLVPGDEVWAVAQ